MSFKETEISAPEAMRLIRAKHEKLILSEFTHFMRTGKLDLSDEDSPPPVFTLIAAGKKSLVYDSGKRVFLREDKILGEKLTKAENSLITILLNVPDTAMSYEQICVRLYADDVSPPQSIDAVELLRPLASRLRKKLDSVNPILRNIIQTVRGGGYVYTPHPSLPK